MGRNRHQQLDRLIEEVARGERELSSIRDAGQREAVRIALRLHEGAAEQLDAYTRIRMRARVMGRLDTRRPGLRDHAWTALELIARPAPYVVRGIAIASVLVCLGMGAIVASADTLPDDLLYSVKLSAEAVRLALADTPSDHAVIETSIAEHRLHEAERLATNGRASDALVASAMYSQHIASAAADLAPAETSGLARQLESRFDADCARAQTLATTLSANATSARAARVLELIAEPTAVAGETGVIRVASTAAGVAEQLVQVAEEAASQAEPADAPVADKAVTPSSGAAAAPSADPSRTPRATTGSGGTSNAAATQSARPRNGPTVTSTARPDMRKANEALRTVRRAAEETRAAAARAKSQGHAHRD